MGDSFPASYARHLPVNSSLSAARLGLIALEKGWDALTAPLHAE